MNITDKPIEIKVGDKLGQGFFVTYLKTEDDSTEGIRNGGFGSSGK